MSFSNGNGSMSPADIAAVMGNNGGGFGGGWGNDWWILLLFLFGWGRNGFGGGGQCGANNTCATPADVHAAVDQQTLISKLDQQTYGLADATYALNNAITGGFSAAELSRCNQQAALMQVLYQMSADSAKCCCETQRLLERGFADTNYNIATQACDTRNTIQNGVRDIIDSNNCGTRAILDALNAQAIAAKDEKIAEQNQRIFALELAASQAKQNSYLLGEIRPCPVPAYITCNPYAPYTAPTGGCGCGNGWAA